jgi:hypothetical protein
MSYTSEGLIQLGFEWEKDFIIYEDSSKGLVWKSENPQPTEAECEVAKAEYDSKAYARNRKAEYPTINELVVALWEGVVEERMASVTALEGLRQAVKAKYPK